MRAIVIAGMLLVLLPAVLSAVPVIGLYFDSPPHALYYAPQPYEMFQGFVFGTDINCYLDAAEFMVTLPAGLVVLACDVPEGSLTLGDPASGISITYWPPMDGWSPGYNLLCRLQFLYVGSVCWCPYRGTAMDLVARIAPHPASGGILGSCYPENDLFNFTGLYSILCPSAMCMGTEETNWGAIKSLYR
jgi:hypothetical protein